MAIALEQSISATVTTGNVTSGSWSPAADELIMVLAFYREETITPTIAGNGLTWVNIFHLDQGRGQNGISVWRAMSASTPSSGTITVTHSGNTKPLGMIALRFSGVDTGGTNGSAAVEAHATYDGTSTDNDDFLGDITTITDNAWALGLGNTRNKNFTVPTDETNILNDIIAGSGGDRVTGQAWYKLITSATTHELGEAASLSSNTSWCMGTFSIKPASTELTETAEVAPITINSQNVDVTIGMGVDEAIATLNALDVGSTVGAVNQTALVAPSTLNALDVGSTLGAVSEQLVEAPITINALDVSADPGANNQPVDEAIVTINSLDVGSTGS